MLKTVIKTTALLLACCCLQHVIAQNRSFSAGSPVAGIGFGNSENYSGLRFNIRDKHVARINGISIAGISKAQIKKGLNIGFIITDSISSGIAISPVFAGATTLSGVGIGGIACGADAINGLGVGGLVVANNKARGITLGIITIADTMQGITLSLCGAFSKNDAGQGNVTGLITSMYVNRLYSLKGLCIGTFNSMECQEGMAIGVYNCSTDLRGIQIGVWNVAKNKKIMKQMPFINFNFKRKRVTAGA